jgi:hypothetical protein
MRAIGDPTCGHRAPSARQWVGARTVNVLIRSRESSILTRSTPQHLIANSCLEHLAELWVRAAGCVHETMGMAELVARGIHRAKGDGDRLAANHRLVRPRIEHHVWSQFRCSSEDVRCSGGSQKPLSSIHPPSMTAVRHCDRTPLLKSGADPCQSRIPLRTLGRGRSYVTTARNTTLRMSALLRIGPGITCSERGQPVCRARRRDLLQRGVVGQVVLGATPGVKGVGGLSGRRRIVSNEPVQHPRRVRRFTNRNRRARYGDAGPVRPPRRQPRPSHAAGSCRGRARTCSHRR